jgi:hypothetical protein
MPATTLRLEHAELCAGCTDLLSSGTTVLVHDDGMVSCLACEEEERSFDHADPWAGIADLELHDLLAARRLLTAA